ncbi:light harvesting complex protein 2 [Tribonema minus]|uniref:Light harvesting complex protein 2 n=1 Tax=Tribonema minus TaxID=303371 RepID=A0A836CLY0_9STRA|nr:light harvesting complex protein 2 [Tribonema minus]
MRMVELGAGVETGNEPWDPMGFSQMYKVNSLGINPHPQWLQESEIKHGRTAMLAFVGTLVIHAGIHIPGLDYTTDWYNSFPEFAAKNPLGLAQVMAGLTIWEGHYGTEAGLMWTGEGTRNPGELGFDPLNLMKGKSEADVNTMKLKEIKNGRLAMIAMAGFASEHFIPGSVPLLSGQGF